MIALKISRSRWMAQLAGALVALSMLPQSALAQDGAAPVAAQAQAQDNAIESISANAQGANVIVNIAMRNAPKKMPIGFLISNPSRIALDFGATSNATGKTSQDLNVGDLRGVNVAQAGERTRLVLNLKRPLNYATAIDGKSIIVTIEGSGGVAQAVNAVGLPVKVAQAPVAAAARCCATSISSGATTAKAGSWSTCPAARWRSTCARWATRCWSIS